MPQGGSFTDSFLAYDHVLLEADGSRQLPLKGWATHEPVIIPEIQAVIAVVPILPIGTTITSQVVHRLPLFLAMMGASTGEGLRVSHYQKMIEGQGGLLEKVTPELPFLLFFNQVESPKALQQARDIVTGLQSSTRQRLHAVITGSVQQQEGVILL